MIAVSLSSYLDRTLNSEYTISAVERHLDSRTQHIDNEPLLLDTHWSRTLKTGTFAHRCLNGWAKCAASLPPEMHTQPAQRPRATAPSFQLSCSHDPRPQHNALLRERRLPHLGRRSHQAQSLDPYSLCAAKGCLAAWWWWRRGWVKSALGCGAGAHQPCREGGAPQRGRRGRLGSRPAGR